jgi:hypothetical protein
MAASEVQIANLALQMLGAPQIQLLTQDTLSAREMNLAFASVRDSELNKRRWRFSIMRSDPLPAMSAQPSTASRAGACSRTCRRRCIFGSSVG